MAILFAEGFDDAVCRGALDGNFVPTIQTAQPRTGTRALRFRTGGSAATSRYRVALPNTATGWCYVAFYAPTLAGMTHVTLTDNGTIHLALRLNVAGKWELYRGDTTLLATGTFVATTSAWVHLAMKWTIDDTTGSFELRVNGSTTADISYSGDTRNGANSYVNLVYLGHLATGPNVTNQDWYLDDVVLQDATGVAPENSWLGDVECVYTFPNAAGDESGFTLGGSSPAATRHEALDDVPPNDATDTVESNTVSEKLLMGYEDLVGSGTIYAVIPLLRAVKSAAGARAIAPREKLGTTARTGSDLALSTSWNTYQGDVWHRDPDGNAWTTANFNASQGGVELTV